MKEFQLTRYLRKWWWIIAVLSVMSGILFYGLVKSRQTYKAQIMIEYTNSDAADGKYPSGDKIDVEEIRSSAVIWNALDSIDRNDSVDAIRSRTSISPVIAEQDESIQTAKWEKGEKYEFFPTQYIISYETVKGDSSSDARMVLEAIVDSYVETFSSKYMSTSSVPNSVESLRNLNYDYIEWAEILDSFIKTDIDYLAKMIKKPPFRSSQSGYSFQDLYNEYNLIYTIYLPSLYALILENHVTSDPELLIARYQYRKNQNNIAIRNLENTLAVTETMLENYTDKNNDTLSFLWGSSEDGSDALQGIGNNYVLNSIYRPENGNSDANSYADVIDYYLRIRSDLQQRVSDNDYCDYVFASFDGEGTEIAAKTDTEVTSQVESIIVFIETRLRVLDKLMSITTSEYIKIEAMKNIKVLSTANVSETINIKLYTSLIIVVFFIIGVAIAVVIGRSLDFVEYHFYTDSTTDLPNRMACDNEIKRYEKKALPIPFTCVVITLTNIKEINSVVGHEGGNEVLRIFAGQIKSCSADFGFVGYNGSLNFMGLFPGCDSSRAVYFRNLLIRATSEFNRGGHGVSIKFKLASSTATAECPRTIRELVSMTMTQLRVEKEIIAEDETITSQSAGV